MEQCARRHRLVVRLKAGDPFVFGRGAEEWAWLAARGWSVEVVPGVSSALALPALHGIPPTSRGFASGFAIVTGHQAEPDPGFWSRYAGVDTPVSYTHLVLSTTHRPGAPVDARDLPADAARAVTAIVERLRQGRVFGAGNFVQGDGIRCV